MPTLIAWLSLLKNFYFFLLSEISFFSSKSLQSVTRERAFYSLLIFCQRYLSNFFIFFVFLKNHENRKPYTYTVSKNVTDYMTFLALPELLGNGFIFRVYF